MTRVERIVLHTFLNDYPLDATYAEIINLLDTDKVEYLDWFDKCKPQDIKEAMFYLHVDLTNLVINEMLDYDKKFIRRAGG